MGFIVLEQIWDWTEATA